MASSAKNAACALLDYDPPQGNVLLISCMDLRLLDDIVEFMNGDNLCNRYDQLVFAGAALGAMGAPGGKDENGDPNEVSHWKTTFADHMKAAVKLHDVKDVYILEHRSCGAYTKVFHIHELDASAQVELDCHADYASRLEKYIGELSQQYGWRLGVHKFLMDLRGDVTVLPDAKKKPAPAKRAAKAPRKKTGGRRS